MMVVWWWYDDDDDDDDSCDDYNRDDHHPINTLTRLEFTIALPIPRAIVTVGAPVIVTLITCNVPMNKKIVR